MNITAKARVFAVAAHDAVGQKRKYTGDPHYLHCEAVANMVESIGGDENMIAAAWLHDTVEDTHIAIENIRREFGADIAELVDWLTDSQTPDDGNRAVRKAREAERLGRAPARAQTIKYADICHNTHSIVTCDPKFARVYLREKKAILEVMTGGDRNLRCQALNYLYFGMKQLGMES